MIDVVIPDFWTDRARRRQFLTAIRATMERMERVHRRKGRDPGAELRASEHAVNVADRRYREAANALVRAEREAIAAEMEATYLNVGADIATAIRARPDLLPEEAA